MDRLSLPITTPRLVLRPHRLDDVGALQAIYTDPRVVPHLLEDAWSDEVALERVSSRLGRVGLDTGAAAMHLVVTRESQPIGNVTLVAARGRPDTAEVGWILAPDAWGHGYAVEAAAALLRSAFPAYGLHRVFARTTPENPASVRVAERLGLRREAHHRQDRLIRGAWTDTLVYAMVGDETHRLPST